MALSLLAAGACAAPGSPGEPGVPTPQPPASTITPIDRLLELSEIESIIGARARGFTRQVALMAADLSDPELERLVFAVRAGFDRELLHRDVAATIAAEAPEGRVEEVLTWLEGGASGEVRTIAAAYEPSVELGDWLDTYTSDPPAADRVRLLARWSEARGEGTFFLLLEQALDEAAHAVWAELRPTAPEFAPLSGPELFSRLDGSSMAAVVTALHAHETVPDSLVRSSVAEYESESGQWYVETYQLAVAEAMRSAGGRVVAALRTQT